MDHIPAHLLETFITVAETKNLVKSALKLGVTQPTLSRQLRQLEEMLPSALFTFQGRSKVLTLYGETLYQSLQNRLSDLTNLVSQVTAHFSDPRNAKLRIVGRREVLQPFISKLQFPGALQFIYLGGSAVVEALNTRNADVSVSQRLPDSPNIAAKPLFKRGFTLVIPKKFSQSKPNLSHVNKLLCSSPCLSFSEDFHTISDLIRYLKIRSEDLQVFRICSDWLTLREMAEEGIGWSLLPATNDFDEKRLWVIDIPPSIIAATQFYILYLKELGSIPWFKEFIKGWRDVL